MRKTFMGVRIRAQREQRGLTQAELAQRLGLSPSYLNQIENNQRPLSVPVLLRLQSLLGLDPQLFSEDEELRRVSQLREVVAEADPLGDIPPAELRVMAQQMPAMAALLVRLHGSHKAMAERLATSADPSSGGMAVAPQAHEEVRDFFYAHHNHIAALDERAESLHGALTGDEAAGPSHDLAVRLEGYLARHHHITTSWTDPAAARPTSLRAFDPRARTLRIAATEPGQRAFQLATQLAHLEAADIIARLAREGRFSGAQARALARIGLASYFAGALVLPYRHFLATAEATRYDIDLLSRRYAVSVETICHRLSTLQRPDARGIPFFFVRVDRAGNMSKRQSATHFHFSRTGGTCPLWNVYEAFAQPGKVLTQLAQMPDGRTHLWIACCVSRRTGGYQSAERSFAVGLGCDLRHAGRLVYARGLDLDSPAGATPIGPGCKVCERQDCPQRAFPALQRPLHVDENVRPWAPYASAPAGRTNATLTLGDSIQRAEHAVRSRSTDRIPPT